MAWADEAERDTAQEYKHVRGDGARGRRAQRRVEDGVDPDFS